MSLRRSAFSVALARFASRLRFPQLFFITFALFIIDLLLPDGVPFADELLLGLITLLLGTLKKKKNGPP